MFFADNLYRSLQANPLDDIQLLVHRGKMSNIHLASLALDTFRLDLLQLLPERQEILYDLEYKYFTKSLWRSEFQTYLKQMILIGIIQ